MVLKILFLFLILSDFSVAASSQTEKLELLFKLGDIDTLVDEIDDLEDDISYKKDYKIYELKALALEDKKKYIPAIKIYQKLILNRYKKQSRALYKKKSKKIKFPQRMFYYYLKTAELYVDYYTTLPPNFKKSRRGKLRKKITNYLRIVRSISTDNEGVTRVHQKMKERDAYLQGLEYKSNFFIFTSILSWQHNLDLKSSETEFQSLSTTIGNCLGAGMNWSNDYYEWITSACYFIGKSTAINNGYNQARVPVTGYLLESGWMTRSFAEDVSIGIFLDALSQTGEWDDSEDPNDSSIIYEIQERNFTRFGYSLKTKWDVSAFSFTISLGRIFQNESYLLQLGSSFNF